MASLMSEATPKPNGQNCCFCCPGHMHSQVDVSPFDGQVPVTAVPEDSDELDREAEWIYKKGFTEPTLTQQRGFMRSDCDEWKSKTATVEKIKKVKRRDSI